MITAIALYVAVGIVLAIWTRRRLRDDLDGCPLIVDAAGFLVIVVMWGPIVLMEAIGQIRIRR